MTEAGCTKLIRNLRLSIDKCWQAYGHPTLSFSNDQVRVALSAGELTQSTPNEAKVADSYIKQQQTLKKAESMKDSIVGTTTSMSSGGVTIYLPTIKIGGKRHIPKGRCGYGYAHRARNEATNWSHKIRTKQATIDDFIHAWENKE